MHFRGDFLRAAKALANSSYGDNSEMRGHLEKKQMKAKQTIPALLLLPISLLAQSAAPDSQATPKTEKTATAAAMPSATVDLANEVLQLRKRMEAQDQRMEAQDEKIRLLEQEVRSRDQQIADLQTATGRMRANAYLATSSSFQNVQTLGVLQSTDSDIKLHSTNVAASMQEEQKPVGETVGSPLAIHYKGVTLSPGGFVGSESVLRQHATGSDVNTPFNSIPFPGNDAAHLTEFFGSARPPLGSPHRSSPSSTLVTCRIRA